MIRKLLAFVVAFALIAKDGLGRANAKAGEELLITIEAAEEAIPKVAEGSTRSTAHELAGDSRGQLGLGTILAAFVVVIASMVVLIVVDRFDQSLGTPSSSGLSTAETDILDGFGDMASLIGPLLLIAIGVVIIGLIRRVQAG